MHLIPLSSFWGVLYHAGRNLSGFAPLREVIITAEIVKSGQSGMKNFRWEQFF